MARPEPVQFERWLACRDTVGRDAYVMVAISGGDLVVVAPPGGTVRFGPDQIAEAEEYRALVGLGIDVLRLQQRRLKQKKSGHPKRRRS